MKKKKKKKMMMMMMKMKMRSKGRRNPPAMKEHLVEPENIQWRRKKKKCQPDAPPNTKKKRTR